MPTVQRKGEADGRWVGKVVHLTLDHEIMPKGTKFLKEKLWIRNPAKTGEWEIVRFLFKMTKALLNFYECSFIHIGVHVVLQPSGICMQKVKQQFCKAGCNCLNCKGE